MTTQRELLSRFHAAARLLSAISFIHTRWPNINGAQITEKLEPIAEALVESVAPAPSPSARAREGWEDWTAEELARELEPWPERSRAKLVAELRGARDQLRHARAFVSAWRLWLERNPHPHKEGPRLLTEMREIEAACLAPTPNAASPWVLRVRVLEAIDEAMVSNGRRARRILERLRRQFERRADGELDPRVAWWTRKALAPEPPHPPTVGVGDDDRDERPECESCGRPIPEGGEGCPEICPRCIKLEKQNEQRAAERERIAVALERAAENDEGPRHWQVTDEVKHLMRCIAADLRDGAAWLGIPEKSAGEVCAESLRLAQIGAEQERDAIQLALMKCADEAQTNGDIPKTASIARLEMTPRIGRSERAVLRWLAGELRAGAAWLRSPLDTSAAMSKHAATPRNDSTRRPLTDSPARVAWMAAELNELAEREPDQYRAWAMRNASHLLEYPECLEGLDHPLTRCACRQIQRDDPARHFKGCPLRVEASRTPADEVGYLARIIDPDEPPGIGANTLAAAILRLVRGKGGAEAMRLVPRVEAMADGRSSWDPAAVLAFVRGWHVGRLHIVSERAVCMLANELEAASHTLRVKP